MTIAIREASREISALSPGAAPAPATMREEVYTGVIERLGVAVERGQAGQAAAAHLLIGEARIGLAQEPLGKLEAERRRISDAGQDIRAGLSQWVRYKAEEAAAESYDPQGELEALDRQIGSRQRALQSAAARQSELASRAEGLSGEAIAHRERGKEARLEESRLGQRMLEMSPREAAEWTEELRALQLRAGEEEANAAILDVKAEQVRRDAANAALEVSRLRRQIEHLGEARDEVLARGERARRTAEEAAAAAEKTAGEIDSLVSELEARIGGTFTPLAEEVLGLLEQAVSSAERARSHPSAASSARVLAGSGHQSIGDVRMLRARLQSVWGGLLDDLARAEPAPAERERYAQLRDEAEETATDLESGACEAYASAQDAYASARIRDPETTGRIERLSALLGELCPEGQGDGGEG